MERYAFKFESFWISQASFRGLFGCLLHRTPLFLERCSETLLSRGCSGFQRFTWWFPRVQLPGRYLQLVLLPSHLLQKEFSGLLKYAYCNCHNCNLRSSLLHVWTHYLNCNLLIDLLLVQCTLFSERHSNASPSRPWRRSWEIGPSSLACQQITYHRLVCS